jgi:hypothetical protein
MKRVAPVEVMAGVVALMLMIAMIVPAAGRVRAVSMSGADGAPARP